MLSWAFWYAPRDTKIMVELSRLKNKGFMHIVVVQLPSHVQLFVTPWTVACQASLSITNSWSLLKLMSIESVMPSNHLLLPPIFLSIRVFSDKSALCIRWPKYWSFSFSITVTIYYSHFKNRP